MTATARKIIGGWLVLGCVLVFIQVLLGGVTRLTGSGLSITKWDIVIGAIPPVGEAQWQAEFEKYQQTPQYQLVNQDMDLAEFKYIYFWEYFHRLWARSMGVIFIVPFLFFLYKNWIDKDLLFKLLIVVLWGGLIGVLGWIMVASGLKEKPYVAPLNLTLHLTPALGLFGYLVWLSAYVLFPKNKPQTTHFSLLRWSKILLVILFIQLFLGGIMSGMKAGLQYPSWPLYNGEFFPAILTTGQKSMEGIVSFDFRAEWGKALIQFLHRNTAYVLVLLVVYFLLKCSRIFIEKPLKTAVRLLVFTVFLQAIIGIITLLNCQGKIPVFWGVAHQAGAMLLIANLVIVFYLTQPVKKKTIAVNES